MDQWKGHLSLTPSISSQLATVVCFLQVSSDQQFKESLKQQLEEKRGEVQELEKQLGEQRGDVIALRGKLATSEEVRIKGSHDV